MKKAADPRSQPANSTIAQSKELLRLRHTLGLIERLSPALAARLAAGLFRRPRRHALPLREVRWGQAAEPLRIPYAPPPGAGRDAPRELSALSWGAGPPVLLQHGWEGRATQMGAFAAPLVAAGLRAVALDASAHGSSTGKTSSLPEFAAGLHAAEREVGPLRGVVGHSLGAAAVADAVGRGLTVERLAFVAPPFDLDVYFELFVGMLGLGDDVHARMIHGYERRFERSWGELRRATTDNNRPLPLLVAHDHDDRETPFAGAQAVTASWPDGRLLATRGLGHLRILRNAEVVEAVAAHMAD